MNQPASPMTDISLLPVYPGILITDIVVVDSVARAAEARAALLATDVIGFDTESKPTFAKGEKSTGPHLAQLATDQKAYLFHLGGAPEAAILDALKAILEAPGTLKVGFGLRDDVKRLRFKLGIGVEPVLDLASALREQENGERLRGDVGAKAAVAQFFGLRMLKSKKTSTSNWSNPRLTDRQMLYAANDAQVALRVYLAWKGRG